MARFVFVVYSNPMSGNESEYNEWYSNRHLDDLLAIPGVVSARRYQFAAEQLADMPAPDQRYLAIYEIEADDTVAFRREMDERVADGRMPVSAALSQAGLHATFWRAI